MMPRLFYRFFKLFTRDPLLHWWIASLLLVSTSFGLADVVRGFPSGLVDYLAAAGIMAGWLLSRWRRAGYWLLPFIILLGWAFALIVLAGLSPGLLAWLRAGGYVIRDAWHWRELGAPDLSPIILAGEEVATLFNQAANRLLAWLAAWRQGAAGYDSLAVALLWSAFFWLLGLWVGWSFQRWRNPLLSALPAGLLLVGSLNYANGVAYLLLPFAGLLIGWIAIFTFQSANQRWQQQRIDFAEDLGMDFGVAGGALVVLLLLLGFAVASFPVISVRAAVQWAHELINPSPARQEAVAESFGLQREDRPTYFQQVSSGELPRRHLLGSGPDLSQRVVMSIQVVSPPASFDPLKHQQAAWRYYWRSLAFDEYTGLGWQSSTTEEVGYAEGTPIRPNESLNRRFVDQQVRLVQDIGPAIYVTGDLFTSDKTFTAAWRPVSSPGIEPGTRLDLFGASLPEKAYRALSTVSAADITALRSAGEEYPDWIAERYLALPASIPDRVYSLANSLTTGPPTPYDRVRTIESYLRGFTYTLDLPTPPVDRDIVDYFIFDLKRGYCDYYASAMVVLARAAGIPARLAVGYAAGSFDPANNRYLITEADAHSWPEIYFPNIGWVEFEPTGSLPEAQRPPLSAAQPIPELPSDLLADYRMSPTGKIFTSALAGLLGATLLVLIIFMTWSRLRFRNLPPAEAIVHLYRHFYRQAHPLAQPLPRGHTPLELAVGLERWLSHQQRLVLRPSFVQKIRAEMQRLTQLYIHTIYSPRSPGMAERREAEQLWQHLHWPLRLAAFAGKLYTKGNTPDAVLDETGLDGEG